MSDHTTPSALIKAHAARLGFDACGFAAAAPVSEQARQQYRRWLDSGRHGCMTWAERHTDVRDDPRRLLDGAATVVMLAINYRPDRTLPPQAPQFAWYAYGRDYHDVLRERLRTLAAFITTHWGGSTRCCVDTAPLRERYWAQQAGIGFVGRNNQLIVPGRGSTFFLGAVLTTLPLPPDEPCTMQCGRCNACIAACPTQALSGGEAVDARRCLSCLTIELRGPLPQAAASALGRRVYGCDECLHACPHNRLARPTAVDDFKPTDHFLALTDRSLHDLTPDGFAALFGHSAVRRAGLDGLKRNLAALTPPDTAESPHSD